MFVTKFWRIATNGSYEPKMDPKEFYKILYTLKTYDLNTADDEGYRNYLSLFMRIDDEGSQEQKDMLQSLSQTGVIPDQAKIEAETEVQEEIVEEEVAEGVLDPAADIRQQENIVEIQEIMSSDVISHTVWGRVIHLIGSIEENGSAPQKEIVHNIIASRPAQDLIKNIVWDTMQSVDVAQMLKAVTISTLYGTLPSVALKAVSLLAGNVDISAVGTTLVDVGVLSALDSLVRYATQGAMGSMASATLAGGASIAIKDFFGYAGAAPGELPFFGPFGRPLLGMIQAAGLSYFQQEMARRGTVGTILKNLDWRDMLGVSDESPKALTKGESAAYLFITNSLTRMIKNETVRGALATTVTYAAEGALIGAVMYGLGIGFHGESTMSYAIAQSMIRGAAEGLYQFSAYREKPVGVLQRLQGGFVARSVQTFIQGGSSVVNPLSIAPILVQQVTKGAVDAVVRSNHGWGNLVKTIFRR